MSGPDPRTAAPRVLYLTKLCPYPPASSGDAVYSRGIIESLAPATRLTVLCAAGGSPPPASTGIDWRITGARRAGRAGAVLSPWPLIAWKGARRDHRAALSRLLRQRWEAIVLDNIGLAHALPAARAARGRHPDTRLIYVSHEHEYPTRRAKYRSYGLSRAARIAAGWDLAKLRRCETALIRAADVVTVIGKADLAPFRRIDATPKYLPLSPGYNGPVLADRHIDTRTPRRVLVLGGRRSEQKRRILLDWLAAAHRPLSQAGIEMVIAGDMDQSLRQRLCRTYPGLTVLGYVDDLAPLFASARMGIVADTTGGGFKLRLLTQVFLRLPIVGLAGAVDGLPTPEGEGYLTAPGLPALTDLVRAVIDDTAGLNRLHDTAFTACRDAFSWPRRGAALTAALTAGTGLS